MVLRPRTRLGKFSFWAFIVFALSLILRVIQYKAEIFHTRAGDLLAVLFFFLEYFAGAVAVLSGLIAIIRYKERSIVVFAYTLLPLAAAAVVLLQSL